MVKRGALNCLLARMCWLHSRPCILLDQSFVYLELENAGKSIILYAKCSNKIFIAKLAFSKVAPPKVTARELIRAGL